MDQNAVDADQRIAKEITGRFGAPSFMRRAKQVEATWRDLLDRLASARRENLEMVRLRLGQVRARAGEWEALRDLVGDGLDEIKRLHDELQPRLRMPLEPTGARRVLRSALRDLREAMEAFNQRWVKLLENTD